MLGTTLTATTHDLPATATLATLGIGFLRFDPGLDLSILGMRGCSQLTPADILLPATISGTTAQATIPVPLDPAPTALRVYLQANAVVPGANPLDLVLSDGLRLTLGR